MDKHAAAAAIAELMANYNEARSRAVAALGNRFEEAQFHAWFTAQVREA